MKFPQYDPNAASQFRSPRSPKAREGQVIMPPSVDAPDCPRRSAFIDELLAKRKRLEQWRKGAA